MLFRGESLNPYFDGSISVRWKNLNTMAYFSQSLNPYFDGSISVSDGSTTRKDVIGSLNPYFDGSISVSKHEVLYRYGI